MPLSFSFMSNAFKPSPWRAARISLRLGFYRILAPIKDRFQSL